MKVGPGPVAVTTKLSHSFSRLETAGGGELKTPGQIKVGMKQKRGFLCGFQGSKRGKGGNEMPSASPCNFALVHCLIIAGASLQMC